MTIDQIAGLLYGASACFGTLAILVLVAMLMDHRKNGR